MTETKQPEREEEAQQERDWMSLEGLDEQQQAQLSDIDAALARIKAWSGAGSLDVADLAPGQGPAQERRHSPTRIGVIQSRPRQRPRANCLPEYAPLRCWIGCRSLQLHWPGPQ